MIIVATNVFAALARTNRVPLFARRGEPTASLPVASVHTTRPHRTSAAVRAGAWIRAAAACSVASTGRILRFKVRLSLSVAPRDHFS